MMRFWFLPFLFADNGEKGGMLKGLMRLSRWVTILLGIATLVAWHYRPYLSDSQHDIGLIATLVPGTYFVIALGGALLVHALYFFTSPTFRVPRMILFACIVAMFMYYYKYGVLPIGWNNIDTAFVYTLRFFSLLSEYI